MLQVWAQPIAPTKKHDPPNEGETMRAKVQYPYKVRVWHQNLFTECFRGRHPPDISPNR